MALRTTPTPVNNANNMQHFTAHAQQNPTRTHSANVAYLQANLTTLVPNFQGTAKVITNWLPDSGASSHMTPNLDDLYDVEKIGYECCVHLADGYTVETKLKGKVDIDMYSNDGLPITLTLEEVILVPGLSRRLFSLTNFASETHSVTLNRTGLHLGFSHYHSSMQTTPLPQ